MSAILILNEMPSTCKECPLFVSSFGNSAYCKMYARYTPEEIESVEDGNLELYYNGCLSKRPNACPLKEESKTKETADNSAWDFHWDGRGSYEQARASFYGEFS